MSHIERSSRLPYVKALESAVSEMKMFSFAGSGALPVFWIHRGVDVETDNNFVMRSYDVGLSCRKWSEQVVI